MARGQDDQRFLFFFSELGKVFVGVVESGT